MTPHVHGDTVDNQTRCVHYHLPLDVVAIRFKCCGRFYPCYKCHDDGETHAPERWPAALLPSEKVVLCGVCKAQLTFEEYAVSACVCCGALFNPKCELHYNIYFER